MEAKAGTCIHCGADPEHARPELTIASSDAGRLDYVERMARAYQETAVARAERLRGIGVVLDAHTRGECPDFAERIRALVDGYEPPPDAGAAGGGG